nr:MAG TPA: hypothetical protein [Caudoviricetes sp.]
MKIQPLQRVQRLISIFQQYTPYICHCQTLLEPIPSFKT